MTTRPVAAWRMEGDTKIKYCFACEQEIPMTGDLWRSEADCHCAACLAAAESADARTAADARAARVADIAAGRVVVTRVPTVPEEGK